MRISKWLWLAAVIGLLLDTAQSQNATDEQIKKAREILEQTPNPAAPGTPPAPAQDSAPAKPAPPAPTAKPEPAPKTPAPVPASAPQQQRLDELMQRYRNGEISPTEYHQARAKILNKPPSFYQPTPEPPKPKPQTPVLAQPAQPAPVAAPPAPTTAASSAAPAGDTAAKAAPSDPALEAALVPGADVVLRLDLSSARQAPVFGVLKAMEDKDTRGQAGGGSALPLNHLGAMLEKTLGLKEEDIQGLVLSADLDGADLSQLSEGPGALKSISGVLGVQLAKAVTIDQLKQAIMAVAGKDDAAKVKVTEDKIGSNSVLTLTHADENDTQVHVAAPGGKMIYAGLNRESVGGALERFAGPKAKLEPAVSGAMNMIAPGAQLKLGFVVPKALKELAAGLAQGGEGQAGGPGAMLAGLMDIRSLALGVALSQDLALSLSGDLGNPDAANAASVLVAMLKPQLKTSVAQELGRTPQSISDQILTSNVKGNLINIKLTMDKALIQSWSQVKPKASASP